MNPILKVNTPKNSERCGPPGRSVRAPRGLDAGASHRSILTGRRARPRCDETRVSGFADPIADGPVPGGDHRVPECLNLGPDLDCVLHHVSSENCKPRLGSPQFFFRIMTRNWRIHLRFPYDSIRCTILLQVLLVTVRGFPRTPDDCCCCGITGSKRWPESLGGGVLTPENSAR